ncbi:hypothetical protein JTE90_002563 [Oedothorax gibbosus]|uniref:Uncharacterized protein n=1 Tax=Oedothorax gibbosus TaxID=931172 RepID=A0AAV6V005_9ARAC|nr:hypothetical protein JTE90_002563 [Oedothorax gibbosus]
MSAKRSLCAPLVRCTHHKSTDATPRRSQTQNSWSQIAGFLLYGLSQKPLPPGQPLTIVTDPTHSFIIHFQDDRERNMIQARIPEVRYIATQPRVHISRSSAIASIFSLQPKALALPSVFVFRICRMSLYGKRAEIPSFGCRITGVPRGTME